MIVWDLSLNEENCALQFYNTLTSIKDYHRTGFNLYSIDPDTGTDFSKKITFGNKAISANLNQTMLSMPRNLYRNELSFLFQPFTELDVQEIRYYMK